MRRHPQVAVDVVTEEAMVDVVGQGFDAGVRLQEFVPPDMIAVPITGPTRSIVVGSPIYLRGESGRRRRLIWRRTPASAGAWGAGQYIAGSLRRAAKPWRSMSRPGCARSSTWCGNRPSDR